MDDAAAVIDLFNAAWGAHDLAATLALCTDDCVFDSTGPAPDGRRCVGHEEIKAAWRPIFDNANSLFEVEELIVTGDRAVQRWRYSWGDGHVRGIDLFRVSDGRVAEKFSYVKG